MNWKHMQFYTFFIIIIVVIGLFCVKKNIEEYLNPPRTIFVSIASYRDQQCSNTLKDLFMNAKYPQNIYVGICQQNKKDDDECELIKECIREGLCVGNQIRKIKLDFSEAKGPAYARYYCSTLYEDETFYLQIDSHINFIEHWDEKLLNMHDNLPPNSIISSYPLDYKDRHKLGVPYICESMYKSHKGIPEYQSYIQEPTERPRLTYIIAAGFLFMPRQAVIDVPFDPHLPYLFMGEETLLAARLWTSGYNIYSPNMNITYHDYGRKDDPKVWNDNKQFNENNKKVINKVLYLLGEKSREDVVPELLLDIDKYGLGNQRTLQEYLHFADLDLKNSKGSKKWCKI